MDQQSAQNQSDSDPTNVYLLEILYFENLLVTALESALSDSY